MAQLNISNASTIMFTMPMWTGMLGALVLRQPWRSRDTVVTAASLVGVGAASRAALSLSHARGALADPTCRRRSPLHPIGWEQLQLLTRKEQLAVTFSAFNAAYKLMAIYTSYRLVQASGASAPTGARALASW